MSTAWSTAACSSSVAVAGTGACMGETNAKETDRATTPAVLVELTGADAVPGGWGPGGLSRVRFADPEFGP